MKKRFTAILVCAALLCGCSGNKPAATETTTTTATAPAETKPEKTFYYITSDGETEDGFLYDVIHDGDNEYATINGHSSPPENMVIPAYIDGYPVQIIRYSAFDRELALKSVTIPDTVIKIDQAFSYCENLETIEIPESVTEIEGYAFEFTPWLEKKKAENPFVVVNNILIDASLMTGDIVIPDNITDIHSGAFAESTITSVTIPEGIEKIHSSTFSWCENLREIKLPSTLKEIGAGAFSGCISLESIVIPPSVTWVSWNAFRGCEKLADITFPEKLNYIGGSAFEDTKWLADRQQENPYVIINNILIDGTAVTGEAVIPDGVVEIGEYAFSDNENLTSVIMPDSVTIVEERAFDECINLENVRFSEFIEDTGYCIFEGCVKLTHLNIPNGIDIDLFESAYGHEEPEFAVTAEYQGNIWNYTADGFVSTASTVER